jgi:carbon monoxide dehydrogenase subunit G
MELTGEHRIPAPRQTVWEALHDPLILKQCITGCQRLEKVDDNHLSATVQAKVGPVKATFDANVEIKNEVPPERYTLAGEGKGGVAGFAKGSADVELRDEGDETVLTYRANAQIGGKLAQIGSRLVETTAKKYAADFFDTFSRIVGGGAPVADAAAADAEAAAMEETEVVDGDRAAAGMAAASVPPPAEAAAVPLAPAATVAPTVTAAPAPSAAPARPAAPTATPPERTSGWIGPLIWGGLAIVAVVVAVLALR